MIILPNSLIKGGQKIIKSIEYHASGTNTNVTTASGYARTLDIGTPAPDRYVIALGIAKIEHGGLGPFINISGMTIGGQSTLFLEDAVLIDSGRSEEHRFTFYISDGPVTSGTSATFAMNLSSSEGTTDFARIMSFTVNASSQPLLFATDRSGSTSATSRSVSLDYARKGAAMGVGLHGENTNRSLSWTGSGNPIERSDAFTDGMNIGAFANLTENASTGNGITFTSLSGAANNIVNFSLSLYAS